MTQVATSRIVSTIDFEAEGKQVGFLLVPYSRNESAWGTLRLPITCVKNGDGPTILFTGGNHGDEYEGIVALLKLARALDAGDVRGRVIILPALNLPAVRAGQRVSPIDGGNMNRVFPGRRDGTVTEVIAHYVGLELVGRADIVVDLHSGGKSLLFIPAAIMHRLDDKEREAETFSALKIFGAPIGLIIRELDMEGMLDHEVESRGKMFISTELGGAGSMTTETVRIAETGLRNLLVHFGLVGGTVEKPAIPTRLMDVPDTECYVQASETGLYEPLIDLGGAVEKGQPVARLHFVDTPSRKPVELIARRPGTLICRRTHGETEAGDMVALIATDLTS